MSEDELLLCSAVFNLYLDVYRIGTWSGLTAFVLVSESPRTASSYWLCVF